jgi:hypothetical protein
MSETVPGGWTSFSCNLSKTDLAVFGKAMHGLVGVNYEPIAVATQVVSGMNCDFFCNARGVYPGALVYAAMVRIYAPATGDPHIVSIRKIDN